MENASLNKAHQQQRCAESLLKHRKYDECIECHKKAIELLEDTKNLTLNKLSLESINLQKQYHQKQIDIVRMKKDQMENYKQQSSANRRKSSTGGANIVQETNGESFELAIYRTIEQHDSLLFCLEKRNNCSDNDSYSISDSEDKLDGIVNITQPQTTTATGSKHPKDEATIIEELKVLSSQLRDSVQFLLTQLDDRNKVIDKLKEQIVHLEGEVHKAQQPRTNNSLKVNTDSSSGGTTSPYVFSPCSEFSPDLMEITSTNRVLPQLAPLEMPNFDFADLMKSPSNNNNN